MSVTEKLAIWAVETPNICTEGPLNKARDAVLDTIGCMIAGAPDLAAQHVRRAVSAWGDGAATVAGQSARLAPPWAAMANGTAAHALDFDDSFSPVLSHASAVKVPALLALAEARGISGHAILDAYVIGLEIQARIGQAVNLEHYHRGWHSTSTVATIGTAAGCARLLGLDFEGMRNAISIAVSTAAGSKRQFGSMVKPMHAGLAAKNAVMAACLAAEGIIAAPEPLEGKWGFRDLFAGTDSPGFDVALVSLGNPLAIEEFGLSPKVYPCCASTHRSLDGLLSLRTEHGINANEVKSITATVPPVNFHNLMYSNPQSEMEKRFSMHYCLATAMIHGAVTLGDFQSDAKTSAEVKAFMPKIEMRMHDGSESLSDSNILRPTQIEIFLHNGTRFATEVEYERGHKQRPLIDEDNARKFIDCVAGMLDSETAETLHETVMNFDTLVSIDNVMTPLRNMRGVAPKASAL